MRKVIALALLLPSLTYGVDFPKWTVENNKACYGFDDAKKLKLAQNECLQLEAQLPVVEKNVDDLQKSIVNLEAAVELSKQAASNLDKTLLQVQKERDEAVRARARAQAHSIFGGGLPWILTAAAVAFAGGLYVGHKY